MHGQKKHQKSLGDGGAKYCIIVIIKCEIAWY